MSRTTMPRNSQRSARTDTEFRHCLCVSGRYRIRSEEAAPGHFDGTGPKRPELCEEICPGGCGNGRFCRCPIAGPACWMSPAISALSPTGAAPKILQQSLSRPAKRSARGHSRGVPRKVTVGLHDCAAIHPASVWSIREWPRTNPLSSVTVAGGPAWAGSEFYQIARQSRGPSKPGQ